jgi:hypothetical protein
VKKIDIVNYLPANHPVKLKDIQFAKHEVALSLESLPPEALAILSPTHKSMLTAKQAVLRFNNGYAMSVITFTPSDTSPLKLFHADERVPTYEVAIIGPDESLEGDPLPHQTVEQVEELIEAVSKRVPKGYH